MYDYLKSIDLFGTIVGLRYKGHWRYKTFLGGIFSIFLVVMALATVGYFSYKFISRERFKLTYEDIKYWNPPIISLKNFKIAVTTQFEFNNEIRKDLFNITFEYVQYNLTTKLLTSTPLNPTDCSPSMFGSLVDEFQNLGLSNGVCLDASNFTIEGSHFNSFYSHLRVRISICSNSTECTSQSNISQTLEKYKPVAKIFFIDSTYQPNKPDEYVIYFINCIDVNITFNDTVETSIFLSQNIMEVQKGWIIDTPPVLFKEIMMDSVRDLSSGRTINHNDLILFNFWSAKKSINYQISYMEISECLADIGGIVNNIMVLFSLIVYYFNNLTFQIEVIKDLFRLKNKELKENKVKFKKAFLKMLNLQHNTSKKDNMGTAHTNFENKGLIEDIYNNKTALTPDNNFLKGKNYVEDKFNKGKTNYIEESRNFKSIKNKQIAKKKKNIIESLGGNNPDIIRMSLKGDGNFTLFEPNDIIYLFFFGWCSQCSSTISDKRECYYKIQEYLDSTQDFSSLFRKLIEIDLMKYLLFNNDQIHVLKYLLKPEIIFEKNDYEQLNQNIDSFSKFYSENNTEHLKDENFLSTISKNETDALIGSLIKIYNDENSEINKKLIKHFESLIKSK